MDIRDFLKRGGFNLPNTSGFAVGDAVICTNLPKQYFDIRVGGTYIVSRVAPIPLAEDQHNATICIEGSEFIYSSSNFKKKGS